MLMRDGPEKGDNAAMNIYVGNLPFSATNDDLERVFSEYGQVDSAAVIMDRDTGRSAVLASSRWAATRKHGKPSKSSMATTSTDGAFASTRLSLVAGNDGFFRRHVPGAGYGRCDTAQCHLQGQARHRPRSGGASLGKDATGSPDSDHPWRSRRTRHLGIRPHAGTDRLALPLGRRPMYSRRRLRKRPPSCVTDRRLTSCRSG